MPVRIVLMKSCSDQAETSTRSGPIGRDLPLHAAMQVGAWQARQS